MPHQVVSCWFVNSNKVRTSSARSRVMNFGPMCFPLPYTYTGKVLVALKMNNIKRDIFTDYTTKPDAEKKYWFLQRCSIRLLYFHGKIQNKPTINLWIKEWTALFVALMSWNIPKLNKEVPFSISLDAIRWTPRVTVSNMLQLWELKFMWRYILTFRTK